MFTGDLIPYDRRLSMKIFRLPVKRLFTDGSDELIDRAAINFDGCEPFCACVMRQSRNADALTLRLELYSERAPGPGENWSCRLRGRQATRGDGGEEIGADVCKALRAHPVGNGIDGVRSMLRQYGLARGWSLRRASLLSRIWSCILRAILSL
jgi:hypothetical protein